MRYFSVFMFSVIAMNTSSAEAAVTKEIVAVKIQMECVVGGTSFGKETYDVEVDVTIYTNPNGFGGSGSYNFSYPYPASATVLVYDPQKLSIKHPSKYAMHFITFFKAHTGASWGKASSTIYFDSFSNFSPVAVTDRVIVGKEKDDVCTFGAILKPKI